MINVLLLMKRYVGSSPLLTEMARLDRENFRVVVCYLSGKDDGCDPVAEVADKTYFLGLRNKQIRPFNCRLLKELKRIIEREEVHVVNCHLQRTIPVGVVASRLARNRPSVIGTLHGLGSANTFKRRLGNRFFYPSLFRIVGVSESVCKDVLKSNPFLNKSKVVTVYNGLNLDSFVLDRAKVELRRQIGILSEKDFCFVTAGRLTAVKNQKLLLNAFKKLLEVKPDCRLLIAGRGGLEADLKSLCGSLSLNEKVDFLGFRQDLPEVFGACDAFVLPSLREGFGLVVIEAMAAGLPVIASNVGGIPELFDFEGQALLVPPGHLDGLVQSMLRMVEFSEAQRVEKGIAGRHRALECFNAKRMTAGYEEIYYEAYRSLSKG